MTTTPNQPIRDWHQQYGGDLTAAEASALKQIENGLCRFDGTLSASSAEHLYLMAKERAERHAQQLRELDCHKPVRDFIQIDGYANEPGGDSIMVPDIDGDVLTAGACRELQSSATTVRICIASGADRADVVRIIRKQLAWIEREDLNVIDSMESELKRTSDKGQRRTEECPEVGTPTYPNGQVPA
jgi:hypothetical protein